MVPLIGSCRGPLRKIAGPPRIPFGARSTGDEAEVLPALEVEAREGGALVMVPNALGAALHRQDLLVRRTAGEFVCLIRRPCDTGSPTPLATVLGALSSDGFLEVEVAVGHSALGRGETVEGAIARAARRDASA